MSQSPLQPATREWVVREPHDGNHLVLMVTDGQPLTAADKQWVERAIETAKAFHADPVRGAVGPAQREVDQLLGE